MTQIHACISRQGRHVSSLKQRNANEDERRDAKKRYGALHSGCVFNSPQLHIENSCLLNGSPKKRYRVADQLSAILRVPQRMFDFASGDAVGVEALVETIKHSCYC